MVELINKGKFVEAGFDKNTNIFIIHVVALKNSEPAISIFFSRALSLDAL